MNAVISLLLVLDLSGSMDQMLEDQSKSIQMKNQARALVSTVDPKARIQTTVFGTRPELGCRDLRSVQGSPEQTIRFLQSQRPGVQGKTPLARTLRQMRPWTANLKKSAAVLITDGADTCGEDPCAALDQLATGLKLDGRSLHLIVVGYDLKSDKKKFECFQKDRGPELTLQFLAADRPWDVQKALSEALSAGRARGISRQGAREDGRPGERGSRDEGRGVRGAGADGTAGAASGGRNGGSSVQKGPGPGHLAIQGAESTDLFQILREGRVEREWYGGLPTELPPGRYEIRYVHPDGKTNAVELKNDDEHRWVLADFLKTPKAPLVWEETSLGFELSADGKTAQMHRDTQPFRISAALSGGSVRLPSVPIGTWIMKVQSPPWMKGRLPDWRIKVSHEQRTEAFSEDYIQKNLKWIENDQPERQRVLQITMGARVESHLIPPGTKRIPLAPQDQAHWLR